MRTEAEKALVSLRVPAEIYQALGQIASVLDRDRSWVMLQAFRHYLAGEGAYILREAEGLAALDRGEGVDFDSVLDDIDQIVLSAERKPVPRRAG